MNFIYRKLVFINNIGLRKKKKKRTNSYRKTNLIHDKISIKENCQNLSEKEKENKNKLKDPKNWSLVLVIQSRPTTKQKKNQL